MTSRNGMLTILETQIRIPLWCCLSIPTGTWMRSRHRPLWMITWCRSLPTSILRQMASWSQQAILEGWMARLSISVILNLLVKISRKLISAGMLWYDYHQLHISEQISDKHWNLSKVMVALATIMPSSSLKKTLRKLKFKSMLLALALNYPSRPINLHFNSIPATAWMVLFQLRRPRATHLAESLDSMAASCSRHKITLMVLITRSVSLSSIISQIGPLS